MKDSPIIRLILLMGLFILSFRIFAYDPTTQPGFKGPEDSSGIDEPRVPGSGSFNLQRYALCEGSGKIIDGEKLGAIISQEGMACLSDGRIYSFNTTTNQIFIIENNRAHLLAGNGLPGDREGPAETAQFRFGGYMCDVANSIALAPNGDIYIGDVVNGKLKKLYKTGSGRWYVKTVAGGGTHVLSQVGDSCNALEAKLPQVGSIRMCGPNNEHCYFFAGRDSWESRYIFYPNGIVKYVGQGAGTADVPYGFSETGYAYQWKHSNWSSVLMRQAKSNGVSTKVVGYSDVEITAKKAEDSTWVVPVDGKVDDCSFWKTAGPLRPDGRAMYTCGGDELHIRRILNGKTTTLNRTTGQWIESRYDRSIGSFGTACPFFVNLDWDGYAYMAFMYGGSGILRGKLYDPITKPQE